VSQALSEMDLGSKLARENCSGFPGPVFKPSFDILASRIEEDTREGSISNKNLQSN
jgi:hypothetical protein